MSSMFQPHIPMFLFWPHSHVPVLVSFPCYCSGLIPMTLCLSGLIPMCLFWSHSHVPVLVSFPCGNTVLIMGYVGFRRYNGRCSLLQFEDPHSRKVCMNLRRSSRQVSPGPSPLERFNHSPYPLVDQFVTSQLTRGGVQGSIRRWTFFPQGTAHFKWHISSLFMWACLFTLKARWCYMT